MSKRKNLNRMEGLQDIQEKKPVISPSRNPVQDHGRPGYKHTPLGWIPEEWDVFYLKDILEEARLGGNYENSTTHGGIPVIKMGNLSRGKITVEELQFLPVDCQFCELDILEKGDLLFNTRNTLDLVGKVAIWQEELPRAVYNSNILRLKFKEKIIDNNYYMNWVFNSHYGLKQLRGFATGTTSVAAIYGRDLDNFKCLIPSKPEQRRIAAILSTWDEAITKTQQLIAQLQQRNKGLMQQLLTGKKRLKGFEGEWKYLSLTQSARIKKGKALSSSALRKGDIPVIAGGKTSPYFHDLYTDENVITISASGAYAGFVAYHMEKIWASDCSTIYGLEDVSSTKFLFYLLSYHQLDIYALQTGGAQPHVYPKDLEILKFNIPALNEQLEIEKVLDMASRELSLYQKYLSELQLQKKGLMQKLLTGEVRVKLSEQDLGI